MAAAVELRIYNGGSRWLLQPHAIIEVWAGTVLLGSLSGRAVSLIVEHHLATAALAMRVQEELARPEPQRMPPAAAPAKKIIPAAQRAALRARRRMRRRGDAPS